jgi:hypothetical protein
MGDLEESLLNVTNVALGVVVLGFLAVLVAGLLWSLSHKKPGATTRRLAVSRPQFGTEQNAAILFELGKKVRYDFSCSPKNCFRTFQHCSRNKMIFGR